MPNLGADKWRGVDLKFLDNRKPSSAVVEGRPGVVKAGNIKGFSTQEDPELFEEALLTQPISKALSAGSWPLPHRPHLRFRRLQRRETRRET